MSRNRRDRRLSNGKIVFITARVRKGLPFVPRESINRIMLGIIARAQGLYKIEVCGFVFLGNHYHIILCGHSCKISPFMNYVQGEIAKALERLIPRFFGGRVWEGRFKEQSLHTEEDVLAKLAYIYLNPVRAGLVARACEYPGICSYNKLKNRNTSISCRRIPSRCLKALPDYYNKSNDLALIKSLLQKADSIEELRIDPLAWAKYIPVSRTEDELISNLFARVEEFEQSLPANFAAMGAKRLRAQRLRKYYKPRDKKPTPYVICQDKELRLELIQSYRDFCCRCKAAWQSLKAGVAAVWPKGAYLPSMRWAALARTPS